MIAAFFDIDGTLYRDSLLIEHFKRLIKYQVIDRNIWSENVRPFFEEWNRREGDYEIYLEALVTSYVKCIKGINIEVIDFIANQVIEDSWSKIYKFTRNQIKWHQENDHKVIFISGSPDFLVEKMARHYNVKDASATQYIIDKNNKLSGVVVPMWDSNSKEQKMNYFMEKYGIDMEKSYSYGDTMGDLTMLKKVGNPVAFNPNRKLINAIIKDDTLKGRIDVVIERKDMCFRVDVENNSIFLD